MKAVFADAFYFFLVPSSSNNTEDIMFDYEPSEFGLDKETAVKIKEIKQLRRLSPSLTQFR